MQEHAPSQNEGQGSNKAEDTVLSTRLFILVSIIVVFIAVLLIFGLVVQWNSFSGGLQQASAQFDAQGKMLTRPDHAAIITYSRGLGAAVNKTSALLLGFVLTFTGTLFVLRNAPSAFKLSASHGKMSGVLQTTSPGLVIASLGTVLTIATIMTKSDLHYEQTIQATPGNVSGHSSSEGSGSPTIPEAPTKCVDPKGDCR